MMLLNLFGTRKRAIAPARLRFQGAAIELWPGGSWVRLVVATISCHQEVQLPLGAIQRLSTMSRPPATRPPMTNLSRGSGPAPRPSST